MAGRTQRRFLVPLILALLSACGFHLRGNLPADSGARSLFVDGIGPANPFYGEFVQSLTYMGGSVVPSVAQAGAVVHILQARHQRRPITLSRQGTANTFDLWFTVVYEVKTPKGEMILPRQELEIRRDYFNDQTSPLGQGAEEALMRQEMQHEAAQNLLRRVVYSLQRSPSSPQS